MSTSKPLKVLVISDGKPGHYNQSLGLAEAMQRHCSAAGSGDLIIEQCAPLSFSQNLSLLLGLASLKRLCPQAIDADFVIAAGHRCHFSLWAISRAAQAKSVVLMKPSLPLNCFDYCIVPEHDGLKSNRRNVIQSRGALNRVVYRGEEKNQQFILLGGPSKHYHWDEADIVSQLQTVLASSTGSWQLVSSRRTPESSLALVSEALPQLTITRPDDVASDWLAKQMPSVQRCWVSPDSVSMVYECLTAQAEVGVLGLNPILNQGQASKQARNIQQLSQQGLLANTADALTPAAGFNEAERCASQLLSA